MTVRNAIQKRDEAAVIEAERQKENRKMLRAAIERQAQLLEKVLPTHMSRDRFEAKTLAAVRSSPDLLHCFETEAGRTSVMVGIVAAASAGLEINDPIAKEAWLIPRMKRVKRGGEWVNSHWEASFQLDYRGVKKLCLRDPRVAQIVSGVVREGDIFEHWRGAEGDHFRHQVIGDNDRPLTHAYAIIRYTDAPALPIVLDRVEVHKRRDVSESYKAEMRKQNPADRRGFWFDWEAEMWEKTAVHAVKSHIDLAPDDRRAWDAHDKVLRPTGTQVLTSGDLAGNGTAELEPASEPHSDADGIEPDDDPEPGQSANGTATSEPDPDAGNPATLKEFKAAAGPRAKALVAAVAQDLERAELDSLEVIYNDPEALDAAMAIIEAGR